MIGTDLHTEKNCVVLGGLDGGRFVTTLSALRSNLSRLETFVGDQSEAFDVAPRMPSSSITWTRAFAMLFPGYSI
jgi:hypothetical protein